MRELTPKQEAFARVYIQTGNATEAYRRVYSDRCSRQTAEVNGYKLRHHTKVALRIEELQAEIWTFAHLTPESIAAELEESRQYARQWKQASAMIRATERKADLKDLFGKRRVDRRQLSAPADLGPVSVEELRELVRRLEAPEHRVLDSPESSIE